MRRLADMLLLLILLRGLLYVDGTTGNLTCHNDYLLEMVCSWESTEHTNCSKDFTVSFGDCESSTACLPSTQEQEEMPAPLCRCRKEVPFFATSVHCNVTVYSEGHILTSRIIDPFKTVKPNPPRNLTAEKQEYQKIKLSWTTEYTTSIIEKKLEFQVMWWMKNPEEQYRYSTVMNGAVNLRIQEVLNPGQYFAKVRSRMSNGIWSEWSNESNWSIDDTSHEDDFLFIAIPLSCFAVLTLIVICHVCFKKLKKKHWEMIPNPSKSQLAKKIFSTHTARSGSSGKGWTSDREELCVEVLQVTNKKAFVENNHQSESIKGEENENYNDTSFASKMSLSDCFQQQHVYPSIVFPSWLLEESPVNMVGSTVICNKSYQLFSAGRASDEINSNSGIHHNTEISHHKTESDAPRLDNLAYSGYKGFESCVAEGHALKGSPEDEQGNTFCVMQVPSDAELLLSFKRQQEPDLFLSESKNVALHSMFAGFQQVCSLEDLSTLNNFNSQHAVHLPYPPFFSVDCQHTEAFKNPSVFESWGPEIFNGSMFNFGSFEDNETKLKTLPFQSLLSQSSPGGVLFGQLNSSGTENLGSLHLLGMPDTPFLYKTGYERFDKCVNKTQLSANENTCC
ncbi:uncharacterized protein LOC122816784 isoform X1 [Protopterus annectens]|uniref:uncharacterized protein LOC122816784 isoform X1 n=1 Tax=Protopterus annectens TaxID=7888 RepID=UPI001CF9C95A|nr:uncharacterized protein LOC122816784 isoform X1 [Protopterus annectens]XP_043945742.1 uncharacterized protein LOC122816784 isoform X1 [Protopterus annectens]XP_043945743.1 uncharacterized protein LOC122816784 isoform X1 [Protopterus annectens]